MIYKKIFVIVVLLFFISCVASPRYSSNPSSGSSKSTKSTWGSNGTGSSWGSSGSSKSKNNKHILEGVSSWYGPNFHGKLTANGEVFDQYGVTAAHQTLPFGTVVRVTNLDNNKSTILRITDRGPFVDNRILDCSYGAALALSFDKAGTANVRIEIIELGDGSYIHHND